MLQQIVGNVDAASAAVLIAFFLGAGIVTTTVIAKYRSKGELDLERLKLANQQDTVLYDRETNRMLGLKKIEQNLITSHREEE